MDSRLSGAQSLKSAVHKVSKDFRVVLFRYTCAIDLFFHSAQSAQSSWWYDKLSLMVLDYALT